MVAPLHAAGGLAAGTSTGAAVAGAEGATGAFDVATDSTSAPPDVYEAVNPPASTELSAENTTCMLPELAVTTLGTVTPLNDPIRVVLLLLPSYTLSRS